MSVAPTASTNDTNNVVSPKEGETAKNMPRPYNRLSEERARSKSLSKKSEAEEETKDTAKILASDAAD